MYNVPLVAVLDGRQDLPEDAPAGSFRDPAVICDVIWREWGKTKSNHQLVQTKKYKDNSNATSIRKYRVFPGGPLFSQK